MCGAKAFVDGVWERQKCRVRCKRAVGLPARPKASTHTGCHTVPPTCTAHTRVPQDYETLSSNVAVRASGSSNARDAAAAQEKLTAYMVSE